MFFPFYSRLPNGEYYCDGFFPSGNRFPDCVPFTSEPFADYRSGEPSYRLPNGSARFTVLSIVENPHGFNVDSQFIRFLPANRAEYAIERVYNGFTVDSR